jgi:hypothetical protein
MKRTVTFTVGVIIFATASAIGKSDQPATNVNATTAEFGQLSVESLTSEQRAMLQSKYRYWHSSAGITAKTPI